MRTTLNLSDELLMQAKLHAAREKTTVTALVESGLRRELRQRMGSQHEDAPELPIFSGQPGVRDRMDLTSNAAMFDACDTQDAQNADPRR